MGKLQVPEYVKEIRKNIRNDSYIPEAVKIILAQNGIDKYPINVFDIAKKLSFAIKYASFQDDAISGILWDGIEPISVEGEQYQRVIFVKKDEIPQRQMFTVAHEIGHFMLHCNDESNFYERYMTKNSNVSKEQKEMEDKADFFAANLILPEDILHRYILVNKLENIDEIVNKVSSDFFVEKETIERRLEEIGYAQ
ncbi:protein of unknown function [Butyrivibrio sp. INlla18]|uniref:ImmA/IrrE family metallo-endopeptidase n=1 Tax=Butyrivibrio sp. INlla18 TaxID=1520806 RepID=UPI00088AB3ED|nr:ImmA/IrrE family metallo-endopeptidase [Butyrivibrio sp. INlla18]SDA73162.1 protein of unknown function [Butyrivibrio sp. INlla18]